MNKYANTTVYLHRCLHKCFGFRVVVVRLSHLTYIFKIVGGKTKETLQTQSSTGHLSFIHHDTNQTG